jgi:hypothetical protein
MFNWLRRLLKTEPPVVFPNVEYQTCTSEVSLENLQRWYAQEVSQRNTSNNPSLRYRVSAFDAGVFNSAYNTFYGMNPRNSTGSVVYVVSTLRMLDDEHCN